MGFVLKFSHSFGCISALIINLNVFIHVIEISSARALEFFVMDLMSKANERIMSKNAKTLTPEHM